MRGVIANFLNPNPYLFWFSVGAPIVLRAANAEPLAAAGFLGGFYSLLVGAKMALSLAVGRSRRFLQSALYVAVVRLLGVVLLILAARFVIDGLGYLGLVG